MGHRRPSGPPIRCRLQPSGESRLSGRLRTLASGTRSSSPSCWRTRRGRPDPCAHRHSTGLGRMAAHGRRVRGTRPDCRGRRGDRRTHRDRPRARSKPDRRDRAGGRRVVGLHALIVALAAWWTPVLSDVAAAGAWLGGGMRGTGRTSRRASCRQVMPPGRRPAAAASCRLDSPVRRLRPSPLTFS